MGMILKAIRSLITFILLTFNILQLNSLI